MRRTRISPEPSQSKPVAPASASVRDARGRTGFIGCQAVSDVSGRKRTILASDFPASEGTSKRRKVRRVLTTCARTRARFSQVARLGGTWAFLFAVWAADLVPQPLSSQLAGPLLADDSARTTPSTTTSESPTDLQYSPTFHELTLKGFPVLSAEGYSLWRPH